MTLKRLVGILGHANRWFPRRHHHKAKPQPFQYHRAEFVEGEWWVLSSSGERLTPYGTDEARAKQCAAFVNNRVNERLAEYARSKANRREIQRHVRATFDCLPHDGRAQ